MSPEEAPTKPGAYQDERGRIWLFERQETTPTLKIRTPEGWVTQTNSPVGRKVLGDVQELRRMVPVRRRT